MGLFIIMDLYINDRTQCGPYRFEIDITLLLCFFFLIPMLFASCYFKPIFPMYTISFSFTLLFVRVFLYFILFFTIGLGSTVKLLVDEEDLNKKRTSLYFSFLPSLKMDGWRRTSFDITTRETLIIIHLLRQPSYKYIPYINLYMRGLQVSRLIVASPSISNKFCYKTEYSAR